VMRDGSRIQRPAPEPSWLCEPSRRTAAATIAAITRERPSVF
jgi:hypothetical protein